LLLNELDRNFIAADPVTTNTFGNRDVVTLQHAWHRDGHHQDRIIKRSRPRDAATRDVTEPLGGSSPPAVGLQTWG
jgi:hypothetical protein